MDRLDILESATLELQVAGTAGMNALTTLARGCLRRCPNCGERHITRGGWKLKERCPSCALHFEREEGYWTGAIAINTVATEVLFAAMLVVVAIWTWPHIPTFKLLAAGLLLNVSFPVLFYPIAKTIWVAIDLVLHPLEERERFEVAQLQEHRERHRIAS
jgi:uncharacterized protein (DUF983 family)